MLKNLKTVLQERLDLGMHPEEAVLAQLFVFLQQWIDLYFSRDFPKDHSRRRRRLLQLVDRLSAEHRQRLKLLIIRRCHAELPTKRVASAHQTHLMDAIKRSNSLPPEATGSSPFGTLRRLRNLKTKSGSFAMRTTKLGAESRRSLSGALDPADIAEAQGRLILLNFKADDIAKQLTLIEFQFFMLVKPSELMDNTWQRPDKHLRAPMVTAMVGFSNKVTNWIEKEILAAHGARQVTALERAIELAERCRELHNFNGMMEVHSALSQGSIARLKSVWARLDPKCTRLFAEHEELLTPVGNFRKYRQLLADLDQTHPTLPYIGLFLRDTLFANEGNKQTLDEANTLINWDKMQIVGHQITNLTRYQQPAFVFPVNLELQELLRSLPRPEEEHDTLVVSSAPASPAPSLHASAATVAAVSAPCTPAASGPTTPAVSVPSTPLDSPNASRSPSMMLNDEASS